MDIFNILRYMHPNAQFSMGDTYDSIVWDSQDIPKPTLQEIESAYPDYQFYLFKNKQGNLYRILSITKLKKKIMEMGFIVRLTLTAPICSGNKKRNLL